MATSATSVHAEQEVRGVAARKPAAVHRPAPVPVVGDDTLQRRGDRLPLPPVSLACPRPYRDLMVKCWAQVPEERPSFQEILALIESMPDVMTDADVTEPTASAVPSLKPGA